MQTIRYGPSGDQEADLYLPTTPRPAIVCLLHGGFWRMPHGRDQMAAIADDLVCRGLAVWNLEYCRLGTAGAGWPATMDDVAAGIDYLAQLSLNGVGIDAAGDESARDALFVAGQDSEGMQCHGKATRGHAISVSE